MKKWLLCAGLPALFLTSCEQQENLNPNKFAGKWIPTEVITNGTSEVYPHEPCGQDYLQLNEYLSFEWMDYQSSEKFNPETNETAVICDGKVSFGSYRIEGSTLHFIQKNNVLKDGEIAISNNELTITRTTYTENSNEPEIVVVKYKKAE